VTDVPANKVPVSVDYTGRDYYALREELIARVKEATNQQWQGNDPADFGLALVEAFAYMGDQINYYIDRIANESYLLTATQRQSLINIAQVYGYTPTGFVSGTVEATFTSAIGSENQIGGTKLGTVDILDETLTPVATPNVATVIVPNNHPFDEGDLVIVSGMAQTQYNGKYEIIRVGIDSGANVICFKPESVINNITGNGTKFTVFTQGEHQFKVGEPIVISGVSPSGYNGNWTVDTVTTDSFTVLSSQSSTFTASGKVNYQDVAVNGDGTTVLGYAYQVGTATIPEGTQLSAEVKYSDKTEQVLFTTIAPVEIGHIGNPNNSRPVTARQGEDVSYREKNLKKTTVTPYDINGELLGYSSGEAEQTFALVETRVDKTYLDVYVDSGTNFNKWEQVQHLTDYGPSSAVYTVTLAANNLVSVNFGDGVSGAIPPRDAAIKAVYLVGGGPIGNIAIGQLKSIVSIPNAFNAEEETILKNFVSVTNDTPGSGGSDPETNDVIRYNAPRALSALNRAVTLEDFANLSLSLRGVGKAKATAETRTSVTVYVAPTQADNSTEVTPGLRNGVETPEQAVLRQNVVDFLEDKKQIGTSITVESPSYVQVELTVEYTPLPQYTDAQVVSFIKSSLFSKFSYNYVDFADVITPEEIEFKLRQVAGVRNIRVTEMHRVGGSGRSSMVGTEKEIFVFREANLTLESAPTNAKLANLVLGSGATLNVSFNEDITNYFAAVTTGTTSVTVTPTLSDATNALLTVNNAVVASGAAQTIATPVGNTVVVISATAGDGVTVRNYRVTFSRIS
jgi:hypothetical protein